ncbi:mechanosensitive ion channel family protein [Halocatena pleomorpha]|uniref:Mechanosensitive ion channel family protein n=2 Tax=Halocatena pleomorpha TaxID=1785090 RepID=A0A3P3R8J9_9EURY|nr:mechanosensitive ion channel family protein [Halocatena pleomorpha]
MRRQSQVENITTTTTNTTATATPESSSTSTPVNTSVREQAVEQSREAIDELFNLFNQWLPTDVARLLVTALVIAIAWYIAKYVARSVEPHVSSQFERPSVTRMILRAIRAVILGIGILFAITNLYSISGNIVVLPLTVFSAIAGVVLAPIVQSFISGLFILADQPYEIGDMIELVNTEQRGFVQDITIRYTKVATLDNTTLVIPNSSMRERDVVNYTAEDARTRLALDIGVTYESDVDTARTLIEDAATDVSGIVSGGPAIRISSARYPAAPTCYITEFGAHSVELQLRYWIAKPSKQYRIRSRVLNEILNRLAESDVELAYPHSHVVFDETSGVLDIDVTREDRRQHRPVDSNSHRQPRPNTND